MLGRGETLPGDCKLVDGSIERSFVSARYDCAGAPAAVELRHPSESAGAAARTQRFAIVPRGAAPPALIDAIARRVSGGEARFQWIDPPPAPLGAPPITRATQPPSLDSAPLRGALAVAFLVAVLAAPLAVVAAVVGSYLAAWRGGGRGPTTSERRRLACYLIVFLAIVALGALRVVPQWGMQLDEERDFILGALCAGGKGCPLVGNEMNQLRIKLGPLSRYLMALCQLVTPDPRFTLWTILAMHALGAAWLAAIGDRLFGFPFGLVAGASFGANPVLLRTLAAASNGAWSSFFLVGAVAGTLRWVRGEPRALLLAATCLAAAAQLHGTNLALVPPIALAAVWWRPRVTAPLLALCALIAGALYSPWLVHQWGSGGSDFFLISTSWMVSEGPGLFERLGRVVPILGGSLATPLAVAGALALAVGGTDDSPPPAVGRTVALLLGLPLGATLLAGGGWAERYGVPVVVPGALAAAAGMRVLATSLARRRGARQVRLAVGALGLAWLAAVVLPGILLRSWPSALGAVEARLGLAEQIEAIRRLGEHGFDTADLESRVHGVSWDRWDGGQAYLGQWLIGTEAGAAGGEHAVVVECEKIGRGFASWQHPIGAAPRGVPRLLVGYRAELAPARVEFIGRDGVLWTKGDALPFYSQMTHGGDGRMRALLAPELAYPPEFADLQRAWSSHPPAAMRLATTLAPGREDRVLVLTYDAGLDATVTVDGAPPRSLETAAPVGNSMRQRFLVEAVERREPVTIEAVIDLLAPATIPRRVDLYEEPPCA
jgi:hypothetical protein